MIMCGLQSPSSSEDQSSTNWTLSHSRSACESDRTSVKHSRLKRYRGLSPRMSVEFYAVMSLCECRNQPRDGTSETCRTARVSAQASSATTIITPKPCIAPGVRIGCEIRFGREVREWRQETRTSSSHLRISPSWPITT